MTMGSLDANVILRLLLKDIPDQHRQAAKLVSGPGQFAIADAAIVEVVFVMGRNYQFPRAEIAEGLLEFLHDETYNCNRALFARALPVFASHLALSFEDCCLAVYAELNDAQPLYTFDRKLAAQLPQTQLV